MFPVNILLYLRGHGSCSDFTLRGYYSKEFL